MRTTHDPHRHDQARGGVPRRACRRRRPAYHSSVTATSAQEVVVDAGNGHVPATSTEHDDEGRDHESSSSQGGQHTGPGSRGTPSPGASTIEGET